MWFAYKFYECRIIMIRYLVGVHIKEKQIRKKAGGILKWG